MTRQESVDLLVAQASSIIKAKIIAWLVSKFIFLSWGPFGPLISHYAGKLAEYIAKDVEMRMFFIYTDLRVDSQGKDYLKAMAVFQKTKLSGNDEEIKNAETILKLSFSNLVRLNS